MLSRHGVRGPYGLGTETPSQALLDKYVLNPELKLPLSAVEWGTSERDDPLETVSPKLTKHGFNVIEHMGEVAVAMSGDWWTALSNDSDRRMTLCERSTSATTCTASSWTTVCAARRSPTPTPTSATMYGSPTVPRVCDAWWDSVWLIWSIS